MADLKVIKISKETYEEISAIAGELQIKIKRPVSIDESMKYLIERSKKGRKISDLAGSWIMSDSEAEEIKASMDKAWKRGNP